MMEITQRRSDEDDNLDVDLKELKLDEDDEKFHYIMVADDGADRIQIPNIMKLIPKYPGENNVVRKRRFPAAIRFHKKRQDIDFLAELMLYYPFRDEKLDLHSDNEELCAQLYQEQYENIRKVKQAGAELGQAQLQLELGFTLVYCIILMITNYHNKSLSTISL